MLTLIGTLLGLVGSWAPTVMKYFENKQQNQHEIAMLDLKAKYAAQGAQIDIAKIEAESAAREGESVRTHDAAVDGGQFINGIRASIRPFITYFFFFAFIGIKGYVLFHVTTLGGLSILQALPIVWDADTQAIFASIMAFWFGGRIIERGYGINTGIPKSLNGANK